MKQRLQAVATPLADEGAPYDFAEFQRRGAARASVPARPRPALRALRIAAVVAPLGLVLLIAGVMREPAAPPGARAEGVAAAAPPLATEPALVRIGPNAMVLELEDRITLLDSLLSQAPAAGLPEEDRIDLQVGRNTLATSLQQVRYARTLLTY
jgi:hypothetical protein